LLERLHAELAPGDQRGVQQRGCASRVTDPAATQQHAFAAFGSAMKMFGQDGTGRRVSMAGRLAALQEMRDKGLFADEQADVLPRGIFRRAADDR
jgi:hypothetical protein